MGGKVLLVPSDISLLEEKYTTSRRRLRFFERTGLAGVLPMWHIRHTKCDKKDFRRVLSRQFGSPETPSEMDNEVLEILKARQQSIRKRVLSQNYLWLGVGLGTGATWHSIRHYDWKTKFIILPFIAYGGSFIGRWMGDLLTGRWKEYGRNRFLGELPAKQYYSPMKGQK